MSVCHMELCSGNQSVSADHTLADDIWPSARHTSVQIAARTHSLLKLEANLQVTACCAFMRKNIISWRASRRTVGYHEQGIYLHNKMGHKQAPVTAMLGKLVSKKVLSAWLYRSQAGWQS